MKNYVKYGWIGNKIPDETMKTLYKIKTETKTPITVLIASAVEEFIKRRLTCQQ